MAIATAMVVRANDVDASAIVHAEVLGSVGVVEIEGMQPLHRYVSRLRVERLKMGSEPSCRQFFGAEGTLFPKRLPGRSADKRVLSRAVVRENQGGQD
jgi:hypothetical protein